ncbi:MAG: hypothetical protein GF388_01020 [Candidatus Aegiribacteria sp.]|nr:hypothetical protein [Candidatus Aegiribacteria sp.]
MANLIVIGTQHELHLTDPIFNLEKLVELIHSTYPDIICAEVSPEQLSGETTCNSKPEYPKAVFPYSTVNNIPVIPIQPCTEIGLEWGDRYRREKARVQENADLKMKWDLWMALSDSCEEVSSPTLHSKQSRAYDMWLEITWGRFRQKLFPKLSSLAEEWNNHFYQNIVKVIQDNPDSRITVTVGIKHKYWLNNRLSELPNVSLEHAEDYIDSKDNIRLTTA